MENESEKRKTKNETSVPRGTFPVEITVFQNAKSAAGDTLAFFMKRLLPKHFTTGQYKCKFL
jgi:hypothetical protein